MVHNKNQAVKIAHMTRKVKQGVVDLKKKVNSAIFNDKEPSLALGRPFNGC